MRIVMASESGERMQYQQFAYAYDRLMEDMPYGEWLRFAQQGWKRYGMPKTVVDLGCGTGTFSILLAHRGIDVIGIDLSEDMLSMAQSKFEAILSGSRPQTGRRRSSPFAAGKGSLRWLQQDMREWELGEPVDAVVSFCDCFNYLLQEDDVVSAIRQTYQGLKAGGTFLFDMLTAHRFREYAAEQPFVLREEDISYIWTCEWEESARTIEHDLTFFCRTKRSYSHTENDSLYERFTEIHRQRAYEPAWIVAQLRAAGFRTVESFADFTWVPAADAAQRVFFCAVK